MNLVASSTQKLKAKEEWQNHLLPCSGLVESENGSDSLRDLSKVMGIPSLGGERKRKRPHVSRKEIKKFFKNRCRICGKLEKTVGTLHMAHYKAHSRGGSMVFPLCPNCHAKYDRGLLTRAQLKKINLSQKEYRKYQPKRRKTKKVESIFDLQKTVFG